MKIYETTSMQHCKPWSFEETTGHPNGYRSLPCDHFRMGVHRVPQMIDGFADCKMFAQQCAAC